MNYSEIIDILTNTIADYFSSVKDTFSYDRTFKARVVSPPVNGYCKVLYNKKELRANTSIPCQAGDYVMVCAPKNNWSELFIAAKRGK